MRTEPIRTVIHGVTLVASLPDSPHPWRMVQLGDRVYLFNPDHQPRSIKLDAIEVVKDGE